MKTVGLLGGMSWESTVPYYQTLNRVVGGELGGFHSARILLLSVDFQEIEERQHEGRWEELGKMLAADARILECAGADFLVLCTNTMHRVAPAIEAALGIPLLHIADATADRIRAQGLQRVGLLGTRFTMEEAFYRSRLEDPHDLEVLVPPPLDRELVHRVIYEELVLGKILAESRGELARIVRSLVSEGAQGVILGCTEIGLLLGPGDSEVPLFDTARIHAEAAAAFALTASSEDLFRRLGELGIRTTTRSHPAVFTVAEAKRLRGEIPGWHVKNLFLRDKKGAMWLVVAPEDRSLDLKTLAGAIGAKRLSLGSAERMMRHLGVPAGTVTPFAVMNDAAGEVSVALDRALLGGGPLNLHPLDNRMTTSIHPEDLLTFLSAENHPPTVLDLSGVEPTGP